MPPGCWPRRSGCRFCRAGQWDVRHRRACACRAPTCGPDAGRCLAAGPAGARRCRPGAAWVSRRGRCSGRGRWQGLSAGVIAGPTTWLLLQQAAHQLQAVSADDNQVRARRQAAQLQLVSLPTGQRVGLHHPASHINQGYVEGSRRQAGQVQGGVGRCRVRKQTRCCGREHHGPHRAERGFARQVGLSRPARALHHSLDV